MSTNMRKCFSLAGPTMSTFDVDPGGPVYPPNPSALPINDYRQPSVRDAVNSWPSPSTWVKLWIDFEWLLAGNQFSDYESCWEYLNSAQGYAMQRLDRQIRAANDDGKYVILSLYHALPPWVTWADRNNQDDGSGRSLSQAYPDPTPGAPWSWLMAYLFARYRGDAAYNAVGPGRSGTNQYGNPYYARVNMIEFTNEPNTICWPTNTFGNQEFACLVAEMFKTAEECSYFWAGTAAPYVLGPAALDVVDLGNQYRMNFEPFQVAILQQLNGWIPRKYVGWSVHNYGDVKHVWVEGHRARRAVQVLYENNWKGGTDGNVFITEGGLNMADAPYRDPATSEATPAAEAEQLTKVHACYTAMYNTPQIYCYLNHIVNDNLGHVFESGVRRGWRGGAPGAPRPLYATWQQLGSSQVP